VGRRRRFDIFLILYLTAVVGFAVVSRERSLESEYWSERVEKAIETFLPRLPLTAESDTMRWYVNGSDTNGLVTGYNEVFQTQIIVSDIHADDNISMNIHSIIRDSLLTSPELLRVGKRSGRGPLEDMIVSFPLSGVFPYTGKYTVNLVGRSTRVRETAPGRFRYRDRHFDSTLASRDLIASLERNVVSFTVNVIDTSMHPVKTFEPLWMSVERTEIVSAIGFEERNTILTNLGWASPDVSVVRGGGRLIRVSSTDRQTEYQWVGRTPSYSDTVVVEARLQRNAGGKDIAVASFAVSGVVPYLIVSPPQLLYSGEELTIDIRITGLEQEQLYTWELFEDAGSRFPVSKLKGSGPLVTYRIPSNYAGKLLAVEARYSGLPYRFISRTSHASGQSRFVFPVISPPTRIEMQFAENITAVQSHRFKASRFFDPRFAGEQPIDRMMDVKVEVVTGDGRVLPTEISMIRKGVFEFLIKDPERIARGGEYALLRISAGETTVHRNVFIRR